MTKKLRGFDADKLERLTDKMPKGLQEFAASLVSMEWGPQIIKRLLDLPENALHDSVSLYFDALSAVKASEDAAARARKHAHTVAMQIWSDAATNWTVKELQEATGYDEED